MRQTFAKHNRDLVFEKPINLLRRISIYRRLIISSLLIIIIPNLIIGYYSFDISSHEMEAKISGSSRQVLKSVESTISEKLKLYEGLSNDVANNIEIRELLKKCSLYLKTADTNSDDRIKYEQCKKEIEMHLYQLSYSKVVNNIEILTGDDEFTAKDAAGIKVGGSLKDAQAYRSCTNYLKAIKADGFPIWSDTSKETGTFLIEPYENGYIGTYLTHLRSITDTITGTSMGVVIVNVPILVFKNMVDLNNMYDENEVVFLVGKEGIISILNGVYNVSKMPGSEILNEMVKTRDGTFTKTISDKEYILTYHSMRTADMIIAYMAERDEILKGVYSVRNITVKVVIVCILCAILISYLVTESISIPTNKLKHAMERIGDNGLEYEYVDNQRDEIGVLGARFNLMMLRIKELVDNLISSELSRKSEEIRRREAELDALQMQINPHFLYNTLNIIRWQAIFQENGESTVSGMIDAFAKLLRLSTKMVKGLVTFQEEFDHINAYIKVIEFKSNEKIILHFRIENEDIFKCGIPKLSLQPLIENIVIHGFSGFGGDKTITIRAYRTSNDIIVQIIDNGRGIPKEDLLKIEHELKSGVKSGKSIGLINVNERIKLNFGSGYGLHLYSEEGKGTTAVLRIPSVIARDPKGEGKQYV